MLANAPTRRWRGLGLLRTFFAPDFFWRQKKSMESERSREDGALLAKSPQLRLGMRSIVVSWMLDVSVGFELKFPTFMAGVDYLDRFLSVRTVERNKLQLVGGTALWLGAKMMEICAPDVRDITHICDGAYIAADVLAMERDIVQALSFTLATRLLQCRSDKVADLATALYVTHRSSLRVETRRARGLIRSITHVLRHGRVAANERVSARTTQRALETAAIFVDQLTDKKLYERGSSICVKFGVHPPHEPRPNEQQAETT